MSRVRLQKGPPDADGLHLTAYKPFFKEGVLRGKKTTLGARLRQAESFPLSDPWAPWAQKSLFEVQRGLAALLRWMSFFKNMFEYS